MEKNSFYDRDIMEDEILDYIPVGHYRREKIENKVMASERKFLFSVFKFIYNDTGEVVQDVATLFYAYLAYKIYFRRQMLQLDSRVGFLNFSYYEEKKTDFIIKDYQPILYRAAIEGFLEKTEDENNINRYIECRITPKLTSEEIKQSVQDINQAISDRYKDHYSIIFHFIKKRNEPHNDKYRDFTQRKVIRQQAYAIYDFRCDKSNWSKDNNVVGKVVGLDAANSELYCRPEVFAQAFRFLRRHNVEVNSIVDDFPYDLNVTYHVGEDFMDISDGLRAVDEAIRFLNLTNGDRLGHALVLGTDVRSYYNHRYHSLCAPKQVLLDDAAWLYHQCIRLMGYSPLCGWLESIFHKYFNEIYKNRPRVGVSFADAFFGETTTDNGLSDDIDDYYLSWLLRGNSPMIGSELSPEHLSKGYFVDRQWAYAGINHHPSSIVALKNSNARELFDAYHSSKYTHKGYEADSITIPPQYRQQYYALLEKIQEYFLNMVEKKHIAIECNPSSNFKIGEMERYDEHPILKFYNYGLNTPYPSHNIAVSINTDDLGIFSTSLEREYSLIALALERNDSADFKNSPRAIIDWLDRVREMSIEQKFRN